MTKGYEFHRYRGVVKCGMRLCVMPRSELALTLHGAEVLLIRKAQVMLGKKFNARNFNMIIQIAD